MTQEQLQALKHWVNAAIDLKIAEAKEDGYTFGPAEYERRLSNELDALFADPIPSQEAS